MKQKAQTKKSKRQRKKLFNHRPFFLLALCFAAGVALGLFSLSFSAVFIAGLCFAGGAGLFFAGLAIIKKSLKCAAAVCCCVFFILGCGAFSLDVKKHENAYIDVDAWVYGVATDKIYTDEKVGTLFLRDVSIKTVGGETLALDGYTRCKLSLSELPVDLRAGDSVELYGRITAADIFLDGEVYTYYYKNDIRYIVKNGSVLSITSEAGTPTLTETVRSGVKQIIYKQVGKQDGGILYALLFGDKTDMDTTAQEAFAEGGIIHLFAVSGLHVGFLSMGLSWILEKLKVKRKYSFIICTVIFGFYAVLCEFSPSVTRAVIMAVILQFSKLVWRKYDLLSAMSLSALVILAFRPLLLFDAGFLLSFACIFGIVTIAPVLQRALARLPEFLRVPLSLSFSVQIATLPLSAALFGKVSLFATLLNLAAIPLITVAFFILFAAVILCFMFPFLAPLIFVPNLIVSALYFASSAAVSTGIAAVIISGFGLLAAGFYLIMFLGRFMLVRRDKKSAVCVMLSLLLLAATFFVNLPSSKSPLTGQATLTAVQATDGTAVIITTSQNNAYLCLSEGGAETLNGIKSVADTYKIKTFDAVIFCSVSLSSTAMFEEIYTVFTVREAVLPFSLSLPPLEAACYIQILNTGVTAVYTDDINKLNALDTGDLVLRYLGDGGAPLALSVSFAGLNTLLIDNLTYEQLTYTFDFAPAEPNLIITSANFDRVTAHFYNALVLFNNRLYNYFDTVITPAQYDVAATPLTLKISGGKITGKRI